MKKRYLSVFILIFLLVYSLPAGARPPQELEQLIDEAAELVLNHHPTLESQRRVLAASRELPDLKVGFPASIDLSADIGTDIDEDEFRALPRAGISLSMPLFEPDRKREQREDELAYLRAVEEGAQKLQDTSERLIARLFDGINALLRLNHSLKGQARLKDVLLNREGELRELIQGGLAEPQDLWDLDERIVEVEVELENLESERMLLIEETARNLGGDEWPRLRGLLDEIAAKGEAVIGSER